MKMPHPSTLPQRENPSPDLKPVEGLGGSGEAEEAPPVLSPKVQALNAKYTEVQMARHELEQAELAVEHWRKEWERKALEFFAMFDA